MAASPWKEAPQELGPAESGWGAFTVIGFDIRFVGAEMAPFVFPALKRRTVATGRRRDQRPLPACDRRVWAREAADRAAGELGVVEPRGT